MTPEERNELFANSLLLILPPVVMHNSLDFNLTPEVIEQARIGNYSMMFAGSECSIYFFRAECYCLHLLPAVEKLWRAAYE